MSDKVQLIYNKIERRIDEICDYGFVLKENQKEYETLTDLEDFIDSLPEEHFNYNNATITPKDFGELPKETLDEAAVRTHIELEESGNLSFINTFSKGAEWKEKQMLGIAEAFYEQGRFEQKQEMMKDAVEGQIYREYIGEDGISNAFGLEAYLNEQNPKHNKFHNGDKIKIIIVKED